MAMAIVDPDVSPSTSLGLAVLARDKSRRGEGLGDVRLRPSLSLLSRLGERPRAGFLRKCDAHRTERRPDRKPCCGYSEDTSTSAPNRSRNPQAERVADADPQLDCPMPGRSALATIEIRR